MAKERKGWKSFEKWLQQEVEETFDITQVTNNIALDQLTQALPPLSDGEKTTAERLRKQLALYVDKWSEEDLKMYFIAHIIDLVAFHQATYRAFFDCTLKTHLKGEFISGRVDCVVGRGTQFPTNPLFFLQEYKPQKNPSGDPLGQLLVAMLATQVLNKDTQSPLYGCYIIGRLWFFVVLQEKSYTVTRAYEATRDDIFDIISILARIRQLYEAKIGR